MHNCRSHFLRASIFTPLLAILLAPSLTADRDRTDPGIRKLYTFWQARTERAATGPSGKPGERRRAARNGWTSPPARGCIPRRHIPPKAASLPRRRIERARSRLARPALRRYRPKRGRHPLRFLLRFQAGNLHSARFRASPCAALPCLRPKSPFALPPLENPRRE